MKDSDVSHMLAVLADADARSTATLVEVIAATTLVKVAPPEPNGVREVEISEGDIQDAMTGFFYSAKYEDGVMKIRVAWDKDSLDSGQAPSAEVTSDSAE
jgi:hypothetical protein